MWTRNHSFLLPIITVLLVSCSASTFISDEEKTRAAADYSACSKIAAMWLAALDVSEYGELLSIDSYEKRATEENILDIVTDFRQSFGAVQKREFLGAHFYSGGKLLSWVPVVDEASLARIHQVKSPDGYYRIRAKYFGLLTVSQMFYGFPEGDYVVFLYRSVPSKKPYAEEKLTFRKAPGGDWQVHGYLIADEV